MTWRAYLVRTVDGTRGARLDLAEGGSWAIPLNGIEDGSVTVAKAQLRAVPPEWWSPWRASVLVVKVLADGTEDPWIAGPIVQPPDETRYTATITFQGIGALLARRVVAAREYGQSTDYPVASDMVWLAKSKAAYRGMSLGTIGQEIVKLATTSKLGGNLPIVFPSPRETGARPRSALMTGSTLPITVRSSG